MLKTNKYYASIYCEDTVIYVLEDEVESNNLEYPDGYSNFYLDPTQWVEITKEKYEENFEF